MPDSQIIPEDRPLSEDETALIRWMLQHPSAYVPDALPQLAQARVISRCACGCATVFFSVGGQVPPRETTSLRVLAAFLYRTPEGHRCGAFVFAQGGMLAGLEIWSVDGLSIPSRLPATDWLTPYDAAPMVTGFKVRSNQPPEFKRFSAGGKSVWLAFAKIPEDMADLVAAKSEEIAGPFGALLAWDARTCSDAQVMQLARSLLDAGCVYFCCWGPDCERVHDLIDTEYSHPDAAADEPQQTLMTTWHAEESLEDALRFSLHDAVPDAAFRDRCKTVLALSIGSVQWAGEMTFLVSRRMM